MSEETHQILLTDAERTYLRECVEIELNIRRTREMHGWQKADDEKWEICASVIGKLGMRM